MPQNECAFKELDDVGFIPQLSTPSDLPPEIQIWLEISKTLTLQLADYTYYIRTVTVIYNEEKNKRHVFGILGNSRNPHLRECTDGVLCFTFHEHVHEFERTMSLPSPLFSLCAMIPSHSFS